MSLDVVYLAWNRREFTEVSFRYLLENTDWSLVDKLHVIDDGSTDGTKELLYEMIHEAPCEYHMHDRHRGGPVEAMNFYVAQSEADWFCKIDNDIVVPPGYLPRLLQVRDDVPGLEAIGMEAGWTELPPQQLPPNFRYGYEPARHIGGVGLIKTVFLGGKPQMIGRGDGGRFGWTEMQGHHRIAAGWIKPDLYLFSLDQLPFEPWASLADQYVEASWSRKWGQYHKKFMCRYWDWAFPDWEATQV